jgi:hypothetical protein
MFRTISLSMLALASTLVVSAGQIQLGGVEGLTSSYVTSGCSGGGGCVAGSTSVGVEANYDTVLFSGAMNGGTSPTPYGGYSTSSANAGAIEDTANNITFSMINDGTTSGLSNNTWILPVNVSSPPTMVIPVGLFGVSDVFTMINSFQGPTGGGRDATVFFDFGTTPNATTVEKIKVKLVNSLDSATPSGATRNSVDCTDPTAACGGVATPASGPLAPVTTTFYPPNIPGVTVVANNLYTFAYTSAAGSYSGSTGSVHLDDQGFLFDNLDLSGLGAGDTNMNTYLVAIEVRDAGVTSGAQIGFSAITVEQSPEPSTVLLFLAGLCTMGLLGRRLRSRA